MVAYIVFAVRGRYFFQTYICDVMSLWQFMNQIGQTNYEIGVMSKSLLSISMMRCRFLMCQHIYAHLVIVVYIHYVVNLHLMTIKHGGGGGGKDTPAALIVYPTLGRCHQHVAQCCENIQSSFRYTNS